MTIYNDVSKRLIPFRPRDAKRVGRDCFYLDWIVWLNGDRIEMADEVKFNVGCYVNGFGGLVFGERTGLGPYSMVTTSKHIFSDASRPLLEQGYQEGPVTMGRDVWIGMGAIVLPDVTIGDGAVVGAGSVVTKNIEPWVVAVGNPCRPVKSRLEGESVPEALGKQ